MSSTSVLNTLSKGTPEDAYTASVAESHRKRFGQFFTPGPVAEFMARWIVDHPSCRRVLDPSLGLGIFFRAILSVRQCDNYEFTGYDLDPTILERAKVLLKRLDFNHAELRNKDYLSDDWDRKYEGIICNPPYFKFQDYDNRAAYLKEFQNRLGVSLSGFTNIYAMFMLKAISQLSPDGRAAFIVPSEFLNADYGVSVKKALLESKALRHVIIFSTGENIFSNALTTSCALLFSNDCHSETVTFTNVRKLGELVELSEQLSVYPDTKLRGAHISSSTLNPEIKWRAYYQKQSGTGLRNLVPLSTYAKVVRGIATGDNDYFTFDERKKADFGIRDKYLLPCLTKSIHAGSGVFTKKDFDDLRLRGKKVFLFNAVDLKDEAVKRYIELGVKAGVNERYLTKHRTPWYALEHRPPAPLLVMVFNRGGLRFVRNDAGVSNLTCFHSVYLNMFALQRADILTAYLLTDLSKEILNDDRREYGGGLNKFEPNDLNGAKVIDMDAIDSRTEQVIQGLYESYRVALLNSQPVAATLRTLNDIFSGILTR